MGSKLCGPMCLLIQATAHRGAPWNTALASQRCPWLTHSEFVTQASFQHFVDHVSLAIIAQHISTVLFHHTI